MMNISLVYPVAGLSSRFNYKAKALTIVGPDNETLIEYSIKQALPAGFTEIIFIVSEKTEKEFREIFKDSYKSIPVKYTKQSFNQKERDKPWGTADAVCTILPIIKNPFIICNGDDLYNPEIFAVLTNHLKNNPEECAAIGYPLENTFKQQSKGNRAIFTTNKEGYVQEIVETYNIEKDKYPELNLTAKDLSSMNIWAITPQTLHHLNFSLIEFKEKNKGNRTIECLNPNELSNLIQKGKIKMKIYPTNTTTIGLTYPEDADKLREFLKQNL